MGRSISSGPMNLCMDMFLRYSQIWSSPVVGSSSFPQSPPLPSVTWVVWLEHLSVETKTKKSLITSAFSMSWVARSPVLFQRGPTFSLVFPLSLMYFSCCPASFNSIRALAFLTWSLTAWTVFVFLPGYLFLCPPLLASFLSFSRSSLFIHISLLSFLPDFLFIVMFFLSLAEVVLEH